jgi:hypothetical protein
MASMLRSIKSPLKFIVSVLICSRRFNNSARQDIIRGKWCRAHNREADGSKRKGMDWKSIVLDVYF